MVNGPNGHVLARGRRGKKSKGKEHKKIEKPKRSGTSRGEPFACFLVSTFELPQST
jgi:hypothetical protein